MAKLNLNKESLEGVRSLLLSSDEGNIIMGLQALENINFRGSLGYILYLYKICPKDGSFWREHAADLANRLRNIGANDKLLSYNRIMAILATEKVALDQVQFVLEMYSENMKTQLQQWGYSEVEQVIIKIKIKKAGL